MPLSALRIQGFLIIYGAGILTGLSMTLISKEFDDIYFSAEDGFAETDFVFLKGCGLPESWQNQSHYTIFETGFGTGLNVLSAAKLFSETAKASQYLDIVSVEKFPLTPDVIKDALAPWAEKLEPFLSTLIDNYPLRISALHPIDLSPNITLHLCFGDIAEIMPCLFEKTKNIKHRQIDAWFLDGFAPAKNPDMWCAELFTAIKDFSHKDTRLATFTAAGLVKRGLESTGLAVEKVRGFGRKRDMLIARGHEELPQKERTIVKDFEKPIAIIGGGIAGCALAHKLSYHNIPHLLNEANTELATGASSNPLGLINPKLTAKETAESSFYSSAYSLALTTACNLNAQHIEIEFNPCGALHLEFNGDKARRFKGYSENLNWHNDHIKMLSTPEASAQAGIDLDFNALFYPDAATLSPKALCKALASKSEIKTGETVEDINKLDAAHIICASAHNLDYSDALKDLPVHKVRGQISLCQNQGKLNDLKTILCFGGYLSPYNEKLNGHVLGASYKKWDETTLLKAEDDDMNCARLEDIAPQLLNKDGISSLNAGLRASSKDRFPIIGFDEAQNISYSIAHGSHGLSSGIYGAYIITAEILGRFIPAYNDVYLKLKASRFDKN
jgi:tRNA 5-methylaminomethyl-2-thiouridine biosynthesis bifunctional protein